MTFIIHPVLHSDLSRLVLSSAAACLQKLLRPTTPTLEGFGLFVQTQGPTSSSPTVPITLLTHLHFFVVSHLLEESLSMKDPRATILGRNAELTPHAPLLAVDSGATQPSHVSRRTQSRQKQATNRKRTQQRQD